MSKVIASLQKNKMYLTSLFLSITAALIIGGILMAVTGFSPLEGYGAMLKGVFGSSRVFGNTLAKMLTLCLTGLAMTDRRVCRRGAASGRWGKHQGS